MSVNVKYPVQLVLKTIMINLKNGNNSSWGDLEHPCQITMKEFQDFLELCGIENYIKFSFAAKIVCGPVLWTSCILGMALNVFIVLPNLISSPTSSSIAAAAIALLLMMRALTQLFRHYMLKGVCKTRPNKTIYTA